MTAVNGRESSNREYARLPEDLLAQMLARTPAMAREVVDLLLPAMSQRDELRQAALEAGLIQKEPHGLAGTVCGVDGGFAVDRTISVDIALAVAVGVEGFSSVGCGWDDNQYQSFARVLTHDVDNERLARAAMICHEMAVLADAPHDVCIYDGSHLTPVIQLNSGFSSRSPMVSDTAQDLAREVGLESALAAFVTEPRVIAMPKYDSSSDVTSLLANRLGRPIPGDDKYVTSLILRGGEYTAPHQVPHEPWAMLHLGTAGTRAAQRGAYVARLDEVIDPLKKRRLAYTYWRPTDNSPSYRIEMKPALADSPEGLGVVFASLREQITAPFVREPYPQYLADVMAKSVGLGLDALQAAAQLQLTRSHPELAPQLITSYRTEGI